MASKKRLKLSLKFETSENERLRVERKRASDSAGYWYERAKSLDEQLAEVRHRHAQLLWELRAAYADPDGVHFQGTRDVLAKLLEPYGGVENPPNWPAVTASPSTPIFAAIVQLPTEEDEDGTP